MQSTSTVALAAVLLLSWAPVSCSADSSSPATDLEQVLRTAQVHIERVAIREALDALEKARVLAQQDRDPDAELSVLNTKAQVYATQQNLEQELRVREEQVRLCRKQNERKPNSKWQAGEMIYLASAGQTLILLRRFDDAIARYRKARAIYKELGQAATGLEKITDTLDPTIAKLGFTIAFVMRQSGQQEEAFKEIRKLVEDGTIGIFISPVGPIEKLGEKTPEYERAFSDFQKHYRAYRDFEAETKHDDAMAELWRAIEACPIQVTVDVIGETSVRRLGFSLSSRFDKIQGARGIEDLISYLGKEDASSRVIDDNTKVFVETIGRTPLKGARLR